MCSELFVPVVHVCSDCGSGYSFYGLFDECKCGVFVCFDVCGVFLVVECSLFHLFFSPGCCKLYKSV